MKFNFRPHHFLCALCFQGRGYSSAFIANFTSIMETLNLIEGNHTVIHIVSHTDSICDPCPNRMRNTCTTEEKITVLDRSHATALDIKAGESMTWGEAKNRIAEKISLEKFHQICATCNWKKYGICENALTKFLGTHSRQS
ncbi:MAG: DUF1284 domain-containing protein [Gammaproteobacteria bacterium]|nr:DUF1284 domain-containing protein [Gammaproteobacteria bacterium]MCW5584254.1 DUF1284 domain-containing protein [Gammaproteobacteria bacterium]